MSRLSISTAVLAAALATTPPVLAQPAADLDGLLAPNADLELRNRDLVIRDQTNTERVRIDSASGSIFVSTEDGQRSFHIDQPGANMFLGGSGSNRANDDGDIVMFSETATNQQVNNASIHLDGGEGVIRLGGGGETGQMVLRAASGAQRMFLDADDAALTLGNGDVGQPGSGRRGRLMLRDADGDTTAAIDGADGRIRANQIVSRAIGRGGAEGIRSASILIESLNPALAFHDTTGGNLAGWYIQAGSTGRLLFQPGTTSGLGGTVMVLEADGGVCLGACN